MISVDVAQHVGEGLAALGGGARQAYADRSGGRAREDRIALDFLHVAGDAFDQLGATAPELVRRHVSGVVHGKLQPLAYAGVMKVSARATTQELRSLPPMTGRQRPSV